jgi:hypothetical protein
MLETVEAAQDAELGKCRAKSASYRERAKGLQTDLRTAQARWKKTGETEDTTV